jgi:hypothetical protein
MGRNSSRGRQSTDLFKQEKKEPHSPTKSKRPKFLERNKGLSQRKLSVRKERSAFEIKGRSLQEKSIESLR